MPDPYINFQIISRAREGLHRQTKLACEWKAECDEAILVGFLLPSHVQALKLGKLRSRMIRQRNYNYYLLTVNLELTIIVRHFVAITYYLPTITQNKW